MTTPSHLIVTAALGKRLRPAMSVATSAALVGSVAPDIPLFLLSLGTALYHRVVLGRSLSGMGSVIFDGLFFSNPYWIASHNLLHAPFVLILGLAFTWRSRRLGSWGNWLFWFFVGAAFHTVVDIPLHATDGPLLLFPLNWTLRFHSPISYWDERYYGRVVSRLEFLLDIVLLVYLAVPYLKRWWRKRPASDTAGPR